MELNKHERNFLLYVETCAVDHGGRLESIRMNNDDMDAAKSLEGKSICSMVRLKMHYIQSMNGFKMKFTHFVSITEKGWETVALLRKEKAVRTLEEYGPDREDLTRDIIPEETK